MGWDDSMWTHWFGSDQGVRGNDFGGMYEKATSTRTGRKIIDLFTFGLAGAEEAYTEKLQAEEQRKADELMAEQERAAALAEMRASYGAPTAAGQQAAQGFAQVLTNQYAYNIAKKQYDTALAAYQQAGGR